MNNLDLPFEAESEYLYQKKIEELGRQLKMAIEQRNKWIIGAGAGPEVIEAEDAELYGVTDD